jgi:hypothetical protein
MAARVDDRLREEDLGGGFKVAFDLVQAPNAPIFPV